MFRAVSWAIIAGVSLIAFNPLSISPAEARYFGGGNFGGGHFGHFGGGHFGGHHFGGGHFGHFGGRHFGHFGGRHFGHFGGRHFGHFGRRHFGHFGGRHFGHHFAGRHFRGHHFARGNYGHGFGGRHFTGNRQFATHGRALAATGRMTRDFGRHGYGHGFARNGFWHHRYADGRYWRGYRNYGWYGPVFWPYAFGDVFAFALWPYDYYDPFWDYGSDWILSSLFWPLGEPGAYYGYGYGGGDDYGDIYGVRSARHHTGTATASITAQRQQEACGSLAPGVSEFPEARIEKAIAKTTDEQRAALKEVNTAMARGADVMKQACPAEPPLTPPAKLDAVTQRLTAMKTAINDVRGPLDKLYSLLSDDQKHRFDQAVLALRSGRSTKSRQASNFDVAQLCGDRGPAFADLPATEIEKAVSLDDSQRSKLDALKTASTKAKGISKSGCISSMPSTVGGRLDATEKRVDALIEAANELKPFVDDFYASLSDEQKARFNSMGQASAQSAPRGTPASSTGASTGEAGSQSLKRRNDAPDRE